MIEKLKETPTGDLKGIALQVWKIEQKFNELIDYIINDSEIAITREEISDIIYVTKDEVEKMCQAVKEEVYDAMAKETPLKEEDEIDGENKES